MRQGERLISSVHCFTKLIKIMKSNLTITFLWYIPIISGFLFPFVSCNQASEFPKASQQPDSVQNQKRDKTGAANIVFISADSGQTWQNISYGLTENLQEDSISASRFFANDEGLFVGFGNGRYHKMPNATTPFGDKEILSNEYSSIAPVKSGIFTYHYWGINVKKTNGTSIWSPIFENFQEPRLRSVFETAGGAIFIGTDRGLFKTTDSGKTWKHVYAGSLVGNLAESNGVLVATSMRKIIRSTDNGENWAVAFSGGVAWDVKQIKDGFAAITSSSASNTRRLRTSYDGGKTWQPLDAGLQDNAIIDSIWRNGNDGLRSQAVMTSIIQVGKNYFCAHPDGIFKSSDEGKTWKLLLPSVERKVFNLFFSGKVIYAILTNRGC